VPGLVLVDSNVLLDIFEEDKVWYDWSAETLAAVAEHSALAINPVIFAEVIRRLRPPRRPSCFAASSPARERSIVSSPLK
jgi:hypothetical protein